MNLLMENKETGEIFNLGEIQNVTHISYIDEFGSDQELITNFNVEPFEGTFEAPGITLKQLQKALGLEKWEITMLRNPRKKNRAFKRRYRKWMKENIK